MLRVKNNNKRYMLNLFEFSSHQEIFRFSVTVTIQANVGDISILT